MTEEKEEQPDDQQEAEKETEGVRLHMVTWNVATADPPADVASLLHLNSPKTADLYVIGLQEVYSGPLRFVSDMIFDDPWSQLFISTLAPRGYVKGNKGGVSVRLSFYGHMLCFLNCHLAAHMNYASERVEEFEYIMETQTFDCKKAPRIVDHRLVFWFGDLNFRIQDHGMHFIRSCINNQTYDLLWSRDQLTMLKKKEPLLQDFEEGPLDFQPSYKFDLNSDTYDSRLYASWFGFNAKKRKPAWTDRILWRVRPKSPPPEEQNVLKERKHNEEEEHPLQVRLNLYTSKMEYSVSDHKPVIGVFTLEVGFGGVSDYITYAWVKDNEAAFNGELMQVFVSKEEIPVRGGDCVLCYYSNNLRSIIGVSEPFKVQESKVAVAEGLFPERISRLDEMTRNQEF
ncbi:PREDICTED: inositol polyphosphate 5-phosphatase K-like isoform X3 [Cyprinodon variegatus]|uniref:inositol polyphosphate 5-phosphatase K-like isoform X3 n=1 Tax=Cyprinodon variegatus TaxID=28743 RepID=UPI000742CA90|nr:PREDICTED: inositol polyphosphate 5-phosphatase K-like isoform X3 [Cyprinodon variegatus]